MNVTWNAVGRQHLLRGSWYSIRFDSRVVVVCAVLVAMVAGIALLSISVGDFPIPLRDVFATLIGAGSPDSEFIVMTFRVPRVLTGILVGAAFGISGAIFQSLVRNPLGSPDIIGFNSGAALGAVFMIAVVGSSSAFAISAGGVLGGMTIAIVVWALAWRGGMNIHRFLLIGIGLGFTAAALVDLMITRADVNVAARSFLWLTGSLNGRTFEHVTYIGVALAVGAPLAVLLNRTLDRLQLGDQLATTLGIGVERAKASAAIVGVFLAAMGVAVAGPIAFVAFVSGPVARRLTGSVGAALIPAALVGSLLTVTADLAARRALAPVQLPVGVATAIIGAPYLLWLLSRQFQRGEL